MEHLKKVILSIGILAIFVTWGCADLRSSMGAAPCECFPGELLTKARPWLGGLVGTLRGATIKANQGQISERGSREAAEHNKPVEYRTEDGLGYYRSEPVSYDSRTKCTKVREMTYEPNQLIKEEVKNVCDVEGDG
jgi:hypothetical protein